MKFSTTAAAALLAATATAQVQTEQKRDADIVANLEKLYSIATRGIDLEKRDAVNQALNQHIKREFDGTMFAELAKRDDVDWSAIINKVILYLPTLFKAIWDSGLIQSIVKSLWENENFRNGLYNALKWVVDLVLGWFSPSPTTSTVAPTATAAPQGKRDDTAETLMHVKRLMTMLETMDQDSTLSARDFADTVSSILSTVWGKVAQYVKDHPEQVSKALQAVGEFAWQVVSKVYVWARDNGYIDKAFKWLGDNLGDILKQVLVWVTSAIGSQSPDPKPKPSTKAEPSAPPATTSTFTPIGTAPKTTSTFTPIGTAPSSISTFTPIGTAPNTTSTLTPIGTAPSTITTVPITTAAKPPQGLKNKRMMY